MIFPQYGATNFLIDLSSIATQADANEEAIVQLTYLNGSTEDVLFGSRKQVTASWMLINIGQAEFAQFYAWASEAIGKDIPVTQMPGELVFGPAYAESNLVIQVKEVKPVGEVAWSEDREMYAIEFTAILLKNGDEVIDDGSDATYNFLVEVDTNAVSVDYGEFATDADLVANLVDVPEGSTAVVRKYGSSTETYARALMQFVDGSWTRIPHLRPFEVDFYGTEEFDAPQREISTLRDGMTWTIIGTFEYKVFHIADTGNGEWVDTEYPYIGRYVPIVANVDALNFRGDKFYFSSFGDYPVAGWDAYSNTPAIYKASIIAKDGISFPSFDTEIENGPSVEKLNGFSVRLDNSNRFHWQTMGFNFFGSRMRLYVLDRSSGEDRKVLIRSGINKTNSLDFANYEFSVEPELFFKASEIVPKTLVAGSDTINLYDEDNGSTKVPLTYGAHPNAKLIPTVNREIRYTMKRYRDEQEVDTFTIASWKQLDDSPTGLAIIKLNLENGVYLPGDDVIYKNDQMEMGDQFQVQMYDEGNEWFIKFDGYPDLVPLVTPKPADLDTYKFGFPVYEHQLPAALGDLLGKGCRIFSINIEFVVDDRPCQGFGEYTPQVMIWNADFEEFHNLPKGLFEPLQYKNGVRLKVKPAYCELNEFNDLIVYERYESPLEMGEFGMLSPNRKPIQTRQDATDTITTYDIDPAYTQKLLTIPVVKIPIIVPGEEIPTASADFYPLQVADESILQLVKSDLGLTADGFVWFKRCSNASEMSDRMNFHTGFGGIRLPPETQFSASLFWANASIYGPMTSRSWWHGGSVPSWLYAQYSQDPEALADALSYTAVDSISMYGGGAGVQDNVAGVLYYPITQETIDAMKGAEEVRLLVAFMFHAYVQGKTGTGAPSVNGGIYNSYQFPVAVTVKLIHKDGYEGNVLVHDAIYDIAAATNSNTLGSRLPHVFNNLPGAMKGGNDRFWNFGNVIEGEVDEELGMLESDLTVYTPFGFSDNGSELVPEIKPLPKFYQWAGVDLFDALPDYLFDESQGFEFQNFIGIRIECCIHRSGVGGPVPPVPIILTMGSDFFNGANDSVFLQRKNNLSVTDTEYFVEIAGRNDKFCDFDNNTQAYKDPVAILGDVAEQIGLKVTDSNVRNIEKYNTKLQLFDDTPMSDVMENCAKHAWAVVSIDETDGIEVKSIDYDDYTASNVKFHFDESNVVKEESLQVQYRAYDEIIRDYTFQFHLRESDNELARQITIKFVNGEIIVDGLETEDVTDPLYDLKSQLQSALIQDFGAKFARSKTYYNSGKENAKTIELPMASDFNIFNLTRPINGVNPTSLEDLADTQPIVTTMRLIRKALQFNLFNSWTISFKAHMKYFIGYEPDEIGGPERLKVGDFIELKTWFHANNNPIRGFVKALNPDLYNGIVEITLFCPVPPDVYAIFYDPYWDGGMIDSGYSAGDYVIDPINRYPFKGATAGAGENPDGEIILPPYDASEATFSDGSYPDAMDENEPF